MAPDTNLNQELQMSLDGFQEKLCHKLFSLWESLQFCDLKLQTSGGVVHVHSCLLAALSPTIADILVIVEHRYQETQEKCPKYITIVIDHLSMEVVQLIVSSIYTGRLKVPSKHVKELLKASRWLKMQHLTSLLERSIAEKNRQSITCQAKPTESSNAYSYSVAISGHISQENHENEAISVLNQRVANPVVMQTSPTSHHNHSTSSPLKDLCTTETPPQVSEISCTKSNRPSSDVSSSLIHSNCEINNCSPTKQTSPQINRAPPKTTTTRTMQLTSPVSKQPCAMKCAEPSLNLPKKILPKDIDTTARRGGRRRKKTKKWEESYLFSPSTKDPEGTNLTDCSVSLIKIEVDDLSTYQSPADQLNFINCNSGFFSISNDNGDLNNCYENAMLESHDLDTDVLDGSVEMEEVVDDGDVRMILDASQDLSTATVEISSENSGTLHNRMLFSFNDEFEKSCTSHVSLSTEPVVVKEEVDSAFEECGSTTNGDGSTENEIDSVINETSQNNHLSTMPESDVTKLDKSKGTSLNKANDKRHGERRFPHNRNLAVFKPYKCQKCPFRFDDVEKYDEHTKNHPVFSCKECPLFFFSKEKHTRHRLSVHLNNRHFICKVCSYQAKSCKDLIHHSTETHNETKPFHCTHPGCSYKAYKHISLLSHVEIVHAVEKNYLCGVCGTAFAQFRALQSHLHSCRRNEEYLCDLCGASFNQKQYLSSHKNIVHYKIRKYTCKLCSKKFSSHTNLSRHLRIHNNVFPYACPVCNRKFRHSNSLKSHLEIHQREGIHVEFPYYNRRCNYKKKVLNPN